MLLQLQDLLWCDTPELCQHATQWDIPVAFASTGQCVFALLVCEY